MKPLLSLSRASILLVILALSNTGQAQPQPPYGEQKKPPEAGKDGPPRREPPPQAYEACKDKKEGAVVQITTPREGKISATCTTSPKGLFARPERPPAPPGPPGSASASGGQASAPPPPPPPPPPKK
ncbi:hypothetical protein H8L32_25320 [Undibacterium sp. CY18W]|uniref:Uncharacterized protein n=1 Tax=Undibacterium hunanense TaxID=2762292 RepID=A0ABR6ZY56_9BURK|nr:hypothetical protein [Undibacterium hunanense]MBC3920811.1 hypothetical protein [Undibacterium hunanense]